ncbi:MAG: hypothetical protein QXG17_01995 [Sulfolobales archaeon]
MLVILSVLALALREIRRSRLAKAVVAVKKMLVTGEEGVSFSRPLNAELGRLTIVGIVGRKGYRALAEFTPSSKLLLGSIRYRDLCSGGYLLAVDSVGNGYLNTPAVRILIKPFENVLVACLDPSEVHTVAKSIEIVEENSTAKSVIHVSGGRYSARVSWESFVLPSWRLVYEPMRGSYRIVKEPGVGVRVRSVRVEVCAKSLSYFTPEICATITRLAKVDSEASGTLEGLIGRRLVVVHMAYVNLLDLARELGIARYPHISGYSSGYIKAKLTMEVPMAKNIVREEPV